VGGRAQLPPAHLLVWDDVAVHHIPALDILQHLQARSFLGAVGHGILVVALIIFFIGLAIGLAIGFFVGRLTSRR
jgi:hypothetical protein